MGLCIGCRTQQAPSCSNCGAPAPVPGAQPIEEIEFLAPIGSGVNYSDFIPRRGANLVLELICIQAPSGGIGPATGAAIDVLEQPINGSPTRVLDTELFDGVLFESASKIQVDGVAEKVRVVLSVSGGVWSVRGWFTDAPRKPVPASVAAPWAVRLSTGTLPQGLPLLDDIDPNYGYQVPVWTMPSNVLAACGSSSAGAALTVSRTYPYSNFVYPYVYGARVSWTGGAPAAGTQVRLEASGGTLIHAEYLGDGVATQGTQDIRLPAPWRYSPGGNAPLRLEVDAPGGAVELLGTLFYQWSPN